MSRGPGKIEQAIERIARHDRRRRLPVVITARDIAREAYDVVFPGDQAETIEPERAAMHKHHVAVIRAMHSFVRKHRAYRLGGGQERTQLVIFRADEVEGTDELLKLGLDLPPWLKRVRRA